MALKDLLNSLGSTSTSSTAAGPLSADLRASYTLNATIAGLEECDALLLVGSNLEIVRAALGMEPPAGPETSGDA